MAGGLVCAADAVTQVHLGGGWWARWCHGRAMGASSVSMRMVVRVAKHRATQPHGRPTKQPLDIQAIEVASTGEVSHGDVVGPSLL